MSFRVNTNVSAMNALRSLSQTGTEMGKSISRLSTGLRINQAGDDPAGLIASENFRAQINSMGQAIRNNQDAVNFAKTAEGALDEINKLLRDARTLAVASGSSTLDASQVQANQAQINSILDSINRIASDTQFGNKKLLNGSAGVVAGVSSNLVESISLSGTFNGAALNTNAAITLDMTTAAEQAVVASATFASATTTMSTGSFSINGVNFQINSGETVADVVSKINSSSSTTGVQASFTAGGAITLTTMSYGSAARIDVADTSGIFLGTAGTASDNGVDAVAEVVIDTNGATAGGVVTVNFTGGRYGYDGLTLTDNDGNVIKLSNAGNASTAATLIGSVAAGSATFQVGAYAGQSVSLSLGNFAASQLGQGAVSGSTLANLDVTSASGATDALKIIDKAISDVTTARGRIGNFQRNTLESQIRSLGVAKENLTATESAIRDVDVAEEMTSFTKLQILQQSGMSVLAQANSLPQQVLRLLG
jgi:flagellin